MRVFMTGASGFIGAVLANRILDRGWQLNALARDPSRLSFLWKRPGLQMIEGSMDEPDALAKLCRDCQGGFHLAGYAKPWAPDPAVYDRANVEGARAVVRAAAAAGVGRLVHVSSAGVFGPSLNGKPVNETTERAVPFLNDYERTKAASETAVLEETAVSPVDGSENGRSGMDVVIVNPTRVYGPSPAVEVAPYNALIARYLRGAWHILPQDGSKVGDYVFVDDVAEGSIAAFEKGRSGERYILGGESLSYSDTFRLAAESYGKRPFLLPMPLFLMTAFVALGLAASRALGKEPPITPAWVRRFCYDWRVDSSKAVEELGYRPTPADRATALTVSWLVERGLA